jgi:hypothetical protein
LATAPLFLGDGLWMAGFGASSHRAEASNQAMLKMPPHSSKSDDRGGPKKNAG